MPKFIDLTGKRFGRLTVLRRAEDTAFKHPQFLCRCDCGTETVVRGLNLRTGNTKSCGCYNRDTHREMCERRNTTHGLSRSRTHVIWINMIQRCTNPNAVGYKNYGGRGISVCDRWRMFENFLADMGECLSPKHTLDRIDNNKGYYADNCRWATMREQQNNRSNNVRVDYQGQSLTTEEWSRRTGIKRHTIDRRLEMGWSVEDALTIKPVLGRNQYSQN